MNFRSQFAVSGLFINICVGFCEKYWLKAITTREPCGIKLPRYVGLTDMHQNAQSLREHGLGSNKMIRIVVPTVRGNVARTIFRYIQKIRGI